MKSSEVDGKLELLLEQAKRLGFVIRKDSGTFESSFCNLNDKRIILINKEDDNEAIVKFLVDNFIQLDLTDVYLMPAVREYLDQYNNKERP